MCDPSLCTPPPPRWASRKSIDPLGARSSQPFCESRPAPPTLSPRPGGKPWTVFRIHDILVWIRIRGSMPLSNGSGSGCGSGSFYFHHWPSRYHLKTNFLKKAFLYITFWKYLYIIFKDKKSKRQNSRNQGFTSYICLMIEGSGNRAGSGSGAIPLTNGSGFGRPKTRGSGTLALT